jgi:hypothetical protein
MGGKTITLRMFGFLALEDTNALKFESNTEIYYIFSHMRRSNIAPSKMTEIPRKAIIHCEEAAIEHGVDDRLPADAVTHSARNCNEILYRMVHSLSLFDFVPRRQHPGTRPLRGGTQVWGVDFLSGVFASSYMSIRMFISGPGYTYAPFQKCLFLCPPFENLKSESLSGKHEHSVQKKYEDSLFSSTVRSLAAVTGLWSL